VHQEAPVKILIPRSLRSFVAGAIVLLAAPAQAAEGRPAIRAVAGVFPPFVMEDRGQLTGFSIDLWNAVAARMEVPTTYQVVPDTASAFEALRSGKADVVVTGHFYTPERDREFDFSYSILNTGQQVMVRSGHQGGGMDTPLRTYLKLLFSRTMFLWFATAALLLVIPAHVVWLLDRRSGEVVGASQRYFPGIFLAMGWAAEALMNQASEMPRRRFARIAAILWLFAGVVFVALLVAQLTAATTLEQFRGLINGPDDLSGKVVATQAGSTSVELLRRIGARTETFAAPDDALSALLAGKVDAVVLAAPALHYYEAHRGAGSARVVGAEFNKRDLGFMVPLDSPLHRKIDSALVALHDDGTYERLREKWFGKE
jgi:polar amino acid transport system substrate-binding protein